MTTIVTLDPTTMIAQEIFDHVNLTSRRGWSRVAIEFDQTRREAFEVRLTHQYPATVGASVSQVDLDLGCDVAMRMSWLKDAVDELTQVFSGRADSFVLNRGVAGAELQVVHSGRIVGQIEGFEEEAFYTDDLLDAVCDAEVRFDPARKELDAWLARANRWDFDSEHRAVRFGYASGDARVVPAEIVATWGKGSVQPGTVLWSWANVGMKDAVRPILREQVERSRGERGLAVLRVEDPILCEEDLAYRLAQVAANRIGARGLIAPLSQGTTRIYIALLGEG